MLSARNVKHFDNNFASGQQSPANSFKNFFLVSSARVVNPSEPKQNHYSYSQIGLASPSLFASHCPQDLSQKKNIIASANR